MILQALTQLYEDLVSQGKIARPGWSATKISYALCLDLAGNLTQIVPVLEEVQRGKKTVLAPTIMRLPAAVKRTAGVNSNFLWDNATYLLGLDSKGKPDRAMECFRDCERKHKEILGNCDVPEAKAILRFFETWIPESAVENPFVSEITEDLSKGGNLTFRINSRYAYEVPEIAESWDAYYNVSDGIQGQCLITGKTDTIESVHPSISGVRGAQSSGAAIVSFNAPAFCSYGKEQSNNAPIGKYAAFAYTSALNYLLADRNTVQYIGDSAIVCWAEGAEEAYQQFAMSALFGSSVQQNMMDADLQAMLRRLAQGLPCEEQALDPARTFYVLGLSPNAARLSVRFFLKDSFGNIMRNVSEHYERLEMIGYFEGQPSRKSPWYLLQETINKNAKDKDPSPVLAGALMRSILSGEMYPAALIEAVMLRIRAEHNITAGRAAIIKAYYLRNPNPQVPKEVLTVGLNEQSSNIPYNLGRMFSVLENIQMTANPGINATIKDKYFNSAASTPATIFPLLQKLSQSHLRKLDVGKRIYLEKQLQDIAGTLSETLPARLSLPEQGSFYLGYYHQTQKRYEKKENK